MKKILGHLTLGLTFGLSALAIADEKPTPDLIANFACSSKEGLCLARATGSGNYYAIHTIASGASKIIRVNRQPVGVGKPGPGRNTIQKYRGVGVYKADDNFVEMAVDITTSTHITTGEIAASVKIGDEAPSSYTLKPVGPKTTH